MPCTLGSHEVSAPVEVEKAAAPLRGMNVGPQEVKSPPTYTTPEANEMAHTKPSGSGSQELAFPVVRSTEARKVRGWRPMLRNRPPT